MAKSIAHVRTAARARPATEATPYSVPVPGSVTVEEVLLAEINHADRTFQYRLRFSAEDLERSLAMDGQQEPIDLIGPKPYRIVDGFRRLEAARSLGWPSIQAIIHPTLSEDEAHTIAFVKNVVRRNLSPIDQAHAIYKARRRGKTVEAIAKELGRSEKQVHRYEEMPRFPPEVQRLLEDQMVSMGHAKVLADFSPSNAEQWADRCRLEAWTVPQLRAALRKAIGKKPGGKEPVYVRIEKDGVRLYAHRISKQAPKAEREAAIAQMMLGAEFLSEGD